MNSALITLIAIIGVPVLVLMLLRINAALVFLSLCLGDVLVQFVAGDTNSFLNLFNSKTAQHVSASNNDIKLALLLLPVVLTAVFMIRTVRGSRLLLNILPAAGVGLLGALLAVPLLPPGIATDILSSPTWQQVTKAEDLIVGASALLCLFALWIQRPKSGGHHKKHAH